MKINSEKQKNQVEKLAAILAEHVDDIQRLSASWGKDIEAIYSNANEKILSLIKDLFFELSENRASIVNTSVRRKILNLRQRISVIRNQCFDDTLSYLNDNIEKYITNEEKFHSDWIVALLAWTIAQQALDKTKGQEVSVTIPSREKLSERVKRFADSEAEKIMRYGIYNGSTIKDIFRKITDLDESRIFSAVVGRITSRDKEQSLASLRREVLQDVKKAMQTTARQIILNTDMVMNGISNDVSVLVSQKNKSLTNGVIWLTVLDERVCDDCASLEGQVFPADEAPSCPLHPNCRCHLVPITDEASELLAKEIK